MVAVMADTGEGRAAGKRIAYRRRELGLSQGQVAIGAGVERSWLARLETGRIGEPGGEKLRRIARVLQTSPEYLLTGTTPPDGVSITVPRDDEADTRWFASLPRSLKRRLRRVGAVLTDELGDMDADLDEAMQQRKDEVMGGEDRQLGGEQEQERSS